jgi:DNA (cytosine-5)-methyltransferase 1
VQPVDVLCGGFPCQDLSVAGKGAGLAGARSGLWSEYARLIGELRPRYVLVENVSALLARGLGAVLGELAALGYDAEWDCLPASAFGAPHQRDRLWLVAYPGGDGVRQFAERDQRQGWRERAAISGDTEPLHDGASRRVADPDDAGREQRRWPQPVRAQQLASERGGEALADPVRSGSPHLEEGSARGGIARRGPVVDSAAGGRGIAERAAAEWWAVEPDVGRVADGVPARVDRLRALGNALVPQIATWLGQRVLDYEATRGVTSVAA